MPHLIYATSEPIRYRVEEVHTSPFTSSGSTTCPADQTRLEVIDKSK